MRLCRYRADGLHAAVGLYDERWIAPLAEAPDWYQKVVGKPLAAPTVLDYLVGDHVLADLNPLSDAAKAAEDLAAWLTEVTLHQPDALAEWTYNPSNVELLLPIPTPNKLFLLAGNYTDHLVEQGYVETERRETFPHVFMKPPSTTLTASGGVVRRPTISPDYIDWELELAVVIGQRAKGIPEEEALEYVAGYCAALDITDRKFRPNPNRRERERDKFFDWLHGKWADSFLPLGPCIATPTDIPDPQALALQLRVNNTLHQDGSTEQMIFSVAAVIAFISSFVTLEPGDVICTGTPAGVGHASGTYLKRGDFIEGLISSIGTVTCWVE